jgi:hypothetical protein
MTGMRDVLQKAGIKPRRWLRDHMAKSRRELRRALVGIAGWHQPSAGRLALRDSWIRSTWESVEFYDVPIPRSLRPDFEQWKRERSAATESVLKELMERRGP